MSMTAAGPVTFVDILMLPVLLMPMMRLPVYVAAARLSTGKATHSAPDQNQTDRSDGEIAGGGQNILGQCSHATGRQLKQGETAIHQHNRPNRLREA